MQNSLKRDLKFNLDDFNLNFSKNIDQTISDNNSQYDEFNTMNDEFNSNGFNIINTSFGDIVIELRNMFFIILELVSLKENSYFLYF